MSTCVYFLYSELFYNHYAILPGIMMIRFTTNGEEGLTMRAAPSLLKYRYKETSFEEKETRINGYKCKT